MAFPVHLPPDVYLNPPQRAEWYQNVTSMIENRYYFKRVYLGCVRANDFLVSLPQFDGTNLGVTGGSQEGAFHVTAALDPE